MEENPLSVPQATAITNIEYLISGFYNDPDHIFNKIIELIEKHKIAEHEEIMVYFYEMFLFKGYIEYAGEIAKRYNIKTEKT